MDPKELLARIGQKAELDDTELAALESDLVETFDALAAESDPEALEALDQLVAAIEDVRTERDAREARAEEATAKVAELASRVHTASDEEEGGDDEEDDAEADTAEAQAEEGDETEEAAAEEVEAPAAKKAAAAQPTPLERIKIPARAKTPPPSTQKLATITASGDVPGYGSGQPLDGREGVGDAMVARIRSISGVSGRDGEKLYVARVTGEFPSERRLQGTASGEQNMLTVDRVASLQAITAAGGVCGPVDPYRDVAIIASAERPVAAALPRFGADRGGIRLIPPPVLADVTADTTGGAVTTQTNADDVSGTLKTCFDVVCDDEQVVLVDGIASCLTFGNIGARTNPERAAGFVDLTAARAARVADTKLLTAIGSGSTSVNGGKIYGAARDILGHAVRAAAGYRSRHRMNTNAPLRAILPAWVIAVFQADLLAGNNGDETFFHVDEAWVRGQFARFGINASFAMDGESGQVFGAQAAGGLLDFPDTMIWYLFHEGAWLYLDGGTLDVGIVRDSTLNAQNRYSFFAEFWENVAFVGVESLRITSNFCANGTFPTGVTADDCSGAAYGS